MYQLSGKKNKVDPRTISAFSVESLLKMLKNGRKKEQTKIIRELAKRTSSDKKEQKAYITAQTFQLVSN
jgi:hypothetical protein